MRSDGLILVYAVVALAMADLMIALIVLGHLLAAGLAATAGLAAVLSAVGRAVGDEDDH